MFRRPQTYAIDSEHRSFTTIIFMDELMDDPPSVSENSVTYHEAFFQFGDEDPICFAYAEHGEFSIILNAEMTEEPAIIFNDGKGKEFKVFLKKSTHEFQQENVQL